MAVSTKGDDTPLILRKNLCVNVVEPNIKNEISSQKLDIILTQFMEILSKRKKYHIGKHTFKSFRKNIFTFNST